MLNTGLDVGDPSVNETELRPSSCPCQSFSLVRDVKKSYVVIACLNSAKMEQIQGINEDPLEWYVT
jgi:hypothetical protein